MSNVNNPFGFRPMIRAGGSPYSVTMYGKTAADSQAIFMFDIVGKAATAVALPENASYNVGGCLSAYTNGGNALPGTSLWLGANLVYGAASTLTTHFVTDEPDVLYIAQTDGGTNALFTANTAIFTSAIGDGLNANIQVSTAGSTATKQSGLQIGMASIATTSSLDLKITRVAMISPNLEGSANVILECSINKHYYGLQTTGV